jgi:hypothetical protein
MKIPPARRIISLWLLVAVAAAISAAIISSWGSISVGSPINVAIFIFSLTVTAPLALLGWLVGVYGGAKMIVSIFRMLGGLQENVSLFDRRLYFNAMNSLYMPQFLTECGLKARSEIFAASKLFVLGIAAAIPLYLLLRFTT